MRRDLAGGKRGDGWRRQVFEDEKRRMVRRPDPRTIRSGKPDPALTSVAGLVPFGVYLNDIGFDAQLEALFGDIKDGRWVVYPMSTQIRTLMDAMAAGEQRVFYLENLCADPLFVHLAGGCVSSIDTMYRDLTRFRAGDISCLEELMAHHGRAIPIPKGLSRIHLDIDSTVEPLFGSQEGAVPGYNPRYPGRPSYHPIIARIAENDAFVGAILRPGNTTLGQDDVPFIRNVVERTKLELGKSKSLRVRIDSAADCTQIMSAIEDLGTVFITKAKMTEDLCRVIDGTPDWVTTDWDVDGKPIRQVAEIDFRRGEWKKAGRNFRVVALRTLEETHGGQIFLWDGLEYTVKAFITCDYEAFADDIIREYDDRAGIEPLIAELKNWWGIGKVPSQSFEANHAMLLTKLLTANLVRRYVLAQAPELSEWRVDWIRRVLFCVPGLLRHRSRGYRLRVPSYSYLARWLN
jgi:hypothetical protein